MTSPLQTLIQSGTKLWLDSIDPDLVAANRKLGASGATSNPIIVADLIETGRFDSLLSDLMEQHDDDEAVAWALTDHLVREAQAAFHDVWKQTRGDDGYVSFELDPLLEDEAAPPHAQRVARYIELGKHWSTGHDNRMIKVPATPAGLEALQELAAAGVTLNVTLIFTARQYEAARDAIWRGAQRRKDATSKFKSVYSIFVSRVDVYTLKHVPRLTVAAQGMVGIVNAKRLWLANETFWADKNLKLRQEIVFASTGTKLPQDSPDKYVEAFAGSDIQTNPPKTNQQVQELGKTYRRNVDAMPPQAVLDEIDAKVDQAAMEQVLMAEGLAKFAQPQKKLLELIGRKRQEMAGLGR
ncbi:MAG: transaldolase [Phycisphaeraceae bacterium]|nr:transaldolase [Phycisphaeraceae bacterium]